MVIISQYGLLFMLSTVLIFHLLVILKIVPYGIVWVGRLKSEKDMYRFETVSILINLIFLVIILLHAGLLDFNFPTMILTVLLWIMAALFALNTLGNIVSKNRLEQMLFTPLTIISTIFASVLALANGGNL